MLIPAIFNALIEVRGNRLAAEFIQFREERVIRFFRSTFEIAQRYSDTTINKVLATLLRKLEGKTGGS